MEQKCLLIAETPAFGELRPEYGPGIRSSVVGRYVIFYRTTDDGIEVIRAIPEATVIGGCQTRPSV